MQKTPRPVSRYRIILLFAIFAASGCETIVMRPRPDVDRKGPEQTPADPGSAKAEIIGQWNG